MRNSLALMLLLVVTALLAGCPGNVRDTPPKIVHVQVDHYVAVPAELTQPCPVFEAQEQTYAEAKRLALLRRQSLEACNADKSKIRALAPAVAP
jgi:hypothetical protein